MRAVTFSAYGAADVLQVTDVPDPQPGPGQVRIAVRAAGVNPWDVKVRSGATRDFAPATFPAKTGLEAAGVVDALGPGTAGAAIGDEVFGLAVGGAAAELALLDAFARKPPATSFEEAAAVAVAAEAAGRAFRAVGGVQAGQTIVIDGAAGGVGAVAVQLARARGATVIGTAGAADHDFLRALGATPTTYGEGLAARVRELAPGAVDLGLDTAGKGGVRDLIALTGDPGRVVTIADFGAGALGVHVTDGSEGRAVEALGEAAALLADGRLRVRLDGTFPFSRAADAHGRAESGRARGKLVLVPG